MNPFLTYGLVAAAGMLAGFLYFGGLWLTLRRVVHSRWAGMLLLGSFLARTAITLMLFYLVMDGNWVRLAVCTAGFFAMRQVLTRFWGPGNNPSNHHGGSPTT